MGGAATNINQTDSRRDTITTALQIPMLLGDGVLGPETRVLALMNGYGLERDLAQWVDGSRVFGGMAFICANRGAPGSAEVRCLIDRSIDRSIEPVHVQM